MPQPDSRSPRVAVPRPSGMLRAWPMLMTAAVAGTIPGCTPAAAVRPGDIRTYAVPKDAESAPLQAARQPDAEPAVARSAIRYVVPEGWSDGGGGGMRLATLFIGDPADKREVTVIPAAGSLAGNVERWLGQLDASAAPAERADRAAAAVAAAETVDVAGTTATIVRLQGPTDGGEAILGAMIPVDDGRSLFVKFKGAAEIATRERERFAAFVASLRWKE
ncbi:MAG: hypothetical protein ACKO4T_05720 [Planctomycetaceae bacterium]